jgi:hypothetical protein
VDGEVDFVAEEGELDFLGEEALAAGVVEGAVGDDVAGGLDEDEFDVDGGVELFEGGGDVLGLHAGEEAAAGAEAEGGFGGGHGRGIVGEAEGVTKGAGARKLLSGRQECPPHRITA